MIPQLLAAFGPMLLKGAMAKFGAGAAAGGSALPAGVQGLLAQEAPTLFASMQGGGQQAPTGGGLLNLQSGGEPPMPSPAQLPGYGSPVNLGRPYQRKFKGLLT